MALICGKTIIMHIYLPSFPSSPRVGIWVCVNWVGENSHSILPVEKVDPYNAEVGDEVKACWGSGKKATWLPAVVAQKGVYKK